MKTIYYLKTASLTILGASCLFLLFNLSGCFSEPDNHTLCWKEMTLSGPSTIAGVPREVDILESTLQIPPPIKIDTIFFEECDTHDIIYTLLLDGIEYDLSNAQFECNVSGDISLVSDKKSSVIVLHANKVGTGTLTITGNLDCNSPILPGGDGEVKVLGTKKIVILPTKLGMTSTVCKDNSGLGSGTLTLIDPVLLQTRDYDWTLAADSPGTADLTPKPGSTDCSVANATDNLFVLVQKKGTKCDQVLFKISVPNCSPPK